MEAQNKKGNFLGTEILVAMDPPGGTRATSTSSTLCCVNVGDDLLSVLKQRANGGPFQPQIYDWRNNIAFAEMYK
eukprot:Awhi_evm1s6714